ncbi:MAG: NADH-quinone oxidoreductase subunit M [Candidatus Sumerlaeia bacterium]|nr:NADH-quinone oxidoreductase subunit M [Candidatus Sumerlaeia bacterium]
MLLSLIIWLPLALGLLALLVVPRPAMKWAALAIMIADLALVGAAAQKFDWQAPNLDAVRALPASEQAAFEVGVHGDRVLSHFQLRESADWLPQFNITYTIGVDHLSFTLMILTALMGVIAVLCSWTAVTEREKTFYFFILLLQTGIMGTFAALDMFLFYIFWELMLVPLYFLIGIFGSSNRIYATMKFVLYTLAGSVLMLLALIWTYYNGGQTYSYEMLLANGSDALRTATWPFLALFFAFAIKVPLFPFHTWLPDAHTEAPTAGSVVLAAVLLKTGVYGMLRFCLPLFPVASLAFAPLIIYLSLIAIVYGALTAMVQTDMKRLVAYSSVSHMGFIVLGVFTFNNQGMTAAILQMFNHGISTGGLFLAVGMIYERRHTREMAKLGGLAHTLPIYASLTMVMLLSSVGLPGLNGFIGEFNILLGSMNAIPMRLMAMEPASFMAALGQSQYTWFVAAIAATGVIFGAVYLLIMYQKVFFGSPAKADHGHGDHGHDHEHDLSVREWGQLAFLSVAALWIGLFPGPMLRELGKATDQSMIAVRPEVEQAARDTGLALSTSAGSERVASAAQ